MDEFEQQLKQALGRRDAPEWFEAKVMAAVRRADAPRPWWQRWFAESRLRWATASLATVMVVTGVAWQRERVAEERAGEQAKAQLELALRITAEKLQIIEHKIHQNE